MSVSHWFRTSFRCSGAFHILVLVVCICGAYATSLSGDFIWDDFDLIVNNDFVHSPSGCLDVFSGDIAAGSGEQYYYYRPLQMLSYWFEYRLWGLWAPGYRGINLLLHLTVCLLFYYFVRSLVGSPLSGLCAALLYGLHPIHSGAISYIAGRADPLAAVFLLAAIMFHRKAVESGRCGPVVGAMFAYMAALFTREHSVVFIGLIGVFQLAWRDRKGIKPLVLYLAITVGYGFFRKGLFPELVVDMSFDTLPERLPVFFVAFTHYLRILIWPFPLHVDYGVIYFSWSDPQTVLGVGLFTGFIVISGWMLWHEPLIGWGLSWFLIALLPFSNIYPLNAYMAEHWLYVPWMGLSMAMVVGARTVWKRVGRPSVLFPFAILLFFSMTVATAMQNHVWRMPIPFYKHMLHYAPDSVILYNRLGLAYMREQRYEEAARSFERAVQLYPDYAPALHNLAILYEKSGDRRTSLALYWRAVQSRPGQQKSWECLMGMMSHSGNRAMMEDFVRQAVQIHPQPELIEIWWREQQSEFLDSE